MQEIYMKEALKEAYKAVDKFEVPIGCVIVKDKKIVGRGHNKKETTNNPLSHAEIEAIKNASENIGAWRLTGCEMYVTVEPCPMCAGAIINSRIDRLIIGTRDKKTGCCGSVMNLVESDKFNHKVEVEFGLMEEECSGLLKDFFKYLRLRKKEDISEV